MVNELTLKFNLMERIDEFEWTAGMSDADQTVEFILSLEPAILDDLKARQIEMEDSNG